MRLRFYKHDVHFVDLELGGDGVGMGMKFITVSFSNVRFRITETEVLYFCLLL